MTPPEPVAGCAECARLARQEHDRERAGDPSRAADARVLLRRHLRTGHGDGEGS